jgi:uncharacterized protein YjbJ (UPF0337 family)
MNSNDVILANRILALDTALKNAIEALENADDDNKTELEGKIEEANDAFTKAIEELREDFEDAADELYDMILEDRANISDILESVYEIYGMINSLEQMDVAIMESFALVVEKLQFVEDTLNAKIEEKGGAKRIDKFACTSDIVPTIFDLFGINYYTNMYYGHSVFSKEQSVLYSRAYNFFLSDGIYGRSVNNVMYMHDLVTKGEFLAYQKEATALVERIRHCDYIFKQDYFSKKSNMDTYVAKMRAINP